MSSGAPFPKRYRRKFSRSKDGCLSCRNRRKKCDGRRPACNLCLQNRLDCQWSSLEGSPGAVKILDLGILTEWPDSGLSQTSRDDQQGHQHDDLRSAKNGVSYLEYEKDGSGSIKRDDRSQSTTPLGARKCNKRRGNSTESSEANGRHVLADFRCSMPSPESQSYPAQQHSSTIRTLASPAANRMQLFNTFLTTHVPSNVLLQEREDSVHLMYFGFLEELARSQCDHPVLSTAMGALSLVSVGCLIRDPEMLRKSSEEYSISVNRLASAVQWQDSVHDDVLLAAIMVLATCEFYEPFSKKSQAQGYYSHIVGLHSLLATRGPQQPKSRLISFVLAKARASSITKSMFSHQKDFYDAPGWRRLSLNVPSLDQDRCYDRGIRMARLFARSDQLHLDDPCSLQKIDELLRDSAYLERDMKTDLDHHVASLWTSIGPSVTLESIERFPRFCKLVANRTLSAAHRFPSYTIAYLYTSYWMRTLMLRTVVMTLQSKRSLLSTDDIPTYAHGLGNIVTESELLHYVICVCRSLPFLAEPACASAGDICSFLPLHWASEYFAKCKNARWCAWIEDVRENFFVRGVSLPALNRLKTPEGMERHQKKQQ